MKRWRHLREWWGRLSLQARLAGAFALLAVGALVFLLAIIARTLGPAQLASGRIIPTIVFVLAVFFVGGWLIARWCLNEISQLGASIHQRSGGPLPAELEGLAALLRREAQKRDRLLQELRRFTADASHELRTPLTALRTVGEATLRDEHLPPAALRDAIGSMLEEAQRMNALIERLLRLARVESEGLPIQKQHIELYPLLQTWCDAVDVLAEEQQARLEIRCSPDLNITTDTELLGHAVLNLLHNAIQHSPSGTCVRVSATSVPGSVLLQVQDEGPGIAPEHHARLFERFYRVDQARARTNGGFGLGLCIAYTAIERLGGKLTLESEPRHGATFHIALPTETEQEA